LVFGNFVVSSRVGSNHYYSHYYIYVSLAS